jgi:uncharacterized protein (DUF1684 family)
MTQLRPPGRDPGKWRPGRLAGLAWTLLLIWTQVLADSRAAPPADPYLASLRAFREGVDFRFNDRVLSPLTEEDRLRFAGLEYFPVDRAAAVRAKLSPAADPTPFAMPTFDRRTLRHARLGVVTARFQGREIRLLAFVRQDPDLAARVALIPFRDATNGVETYAGGRYIEIDLPVAERFLLDFNRAMNPWCAYDSSYACPIPPAENHLPIAIRAGEKKFRR